MTTSKVRLQPMLHRFIKVFLALALMVVSGCHKNQEEGWTWEMWLKNLSIQAGFSTSESEAISDLMEFNVVDASTYALDSPLTVNMVIASSAKLTDKVSQLNEENWKEDHLLTASQAQQMLNRLVELMNDFSEEKYEIVYETEPIEVNVIDRQGNQFLIEQKVNIGDLIEFDGKVYQVSEVTGQWIQVKEVSYDQVNSLDLQGSVSLDLSKAITIVKNEIIQINERTGAGLSAPALSQSFEVQGFQVRISTSSDSLHIYASKKMKSGQPVFVQFDINEIHCDFKWKSQKDQIEASALKVSYETSLTSGLRSADMEDRVLDFAKLDPHHLLETIQNSVVYKSDALAESIELCEIHLPFPQFPSVMLKMKVFLHLYASGRAEIGFESSQVAGFESINGKLRLIHDTQKEAYFSVRASAKASTKVQFILSAFMQDLMDAAVELGIQGIAVSKIQLNDQIFESDVSYELLEEAVQNQDGLKVCADLDAFWLLNLSLNSSQSVLGQFGLSYQTDLINQYNGSLFGETIHLENFQRVKQCTGTFTQDEVEIKLNLDRIELKNYLMILDEGESQWIAVSAFPFGVEKRDILYTSSDTNVATVSSNGKVKAVKSGNAIVTVALKDGSYAAQCSVFVR